MTPSPTRRLAIPIASALLCFALAAHADELNFYKQSAKKGCKSLITEAAQRECKAKQETVDESCKKAFVCEVNKQERDIRKYQDTRAQLRDGKVADSDRKSLERKVQDLKEILDARKEAAKETRELADKCVDAREDIRDWFDDDAIRVTKETRDEALDERKQLLDDLDKAKKKQADKREKHRDDPRDQDARREFDDATKEVREAEQALTRFNSKYGKWLERYADRLIQHYKDENQQHDKARKNAKERSDNCEKLERLTY